MPLEQIPVITSAEDAYRVLSAYASLPQIHVLVLCVDGRNRLQSVSIVHVGTEDEYVLSPSIIHGHALQNETYGYIVGITHPWGHAVPTPTDIQYGRKLRNTSVELTTPLLDVIIIGIDDYTSMSEAGLFN